MPPSRIRQSGRRPRSRLGPGLLLVLVAFGGCSGGTRPELGEVQGTVTLDGRPLAEAIVVFTPSEGGRQSMGVTDQEGRYTLYYIRDIAGAKIGPHTVAVTMAEGARFPGPIPPRYNTQTTLRQDVQTGANQCDFRLASRSASS